MSKCEICGKEFENYVGIASHIAQRHKNEITIEEYYLKYIGEKGKCKTCGKDTKFYTLEKGYNKYCNRTCATNNFEVLKKRKETRIKNNNIAKHKVKPENNPNMIKCEICKEWFKDICSLSKHIVRGHKIKLEEYYLKYINSEKGICKTCGKDTKLINLRDGYSTFCSCKCSAVNSETRKKSINTCIEKYGKENVFQTEEVKQKSINTCIEKYGVDNYSKTKEFKIKSEETCLKNHGVKHAYQNKEIRKKGEETCLKNHGVRHSFQSLKIRKKAEGTCLKKYKVKHYLQSQEGKEKYKQTCLQNMNVDNSSKCPKVIKKIKESTLRNNNGINPNKLTYQQCLERYPDVVRIEGLKEGPNGEILAHCKNSKCKNSKENGGWFEVIAQQIMWRNDGINRHDTDNFYCSQECKDTCPIYGKSAVRLHNLLNENPEIIYTQEEYNTWHEEVLKRQKIENNVDINFCEYCHSTENLHVHHEVPQKLEPGYALDPNNGIIVCEKCHYKYGHKKGTECSTGKLANKICK